MKKSNASGESNEWTGTRPIIVGGLHGSGAHLLPGLFEQHPDIDTMGAKREDEAETEFVEGQANQSVFEHEDYFGGAGAFAFHPEAHLDPGDPRWDGPQFEQLRSDWEELWADDAPVGVEYSPSNVVRAKFLAEAFPDAVHVYVHRNPVLDALRTRRETGDRSQSLATLVRHWLTAHRQLLADISALDNCVLVSFNELRRNPNEVLNRVVEAAGLDTWTFDPAELRSVGRDTWTGWEEKSQDQQAPVFEYETEIGWFGYSLERPGFQGDIDRDAILGRGVLQRGLDVDALRPDELTLTDLEPPGTVPERLLCVAFGTRRDVEPVIAAARTFAECGYDVVVCSTETHRELADVLGVPFVSVHPEAHIDRPAPAPATEKEQLEAYYTELSQFYATYAEDIVRTVTEEVNRADCALVGRGVFFRGLLAYYFQLPLVDLTDTPGHLGPDEAGTDSVERFAADLITHSYALSNFKLGQALDEAYEACGIEHRHTDEGFNESLIRTQSTRILRQSWPSLGEHEIPGLPDRATGAWRTVPADGGGRLDGETGEFLSGATTPVCLDFATVDLFAPDSPAWTDRLLDALAGTGRPLLVVGEDTDRALPSNARRIGPVEARNRYGQCAFVVHDASPQTTIACVEAETPALAVPTTDWDRAHSWARWLDRGEAGRYVPDREADFEAVLSSFDADRFEEGVRALAADIDAGGDDLVRAFEDLFGDPDPSLTRDWQSMVYINSLPIAEWRKSELIAHPLFREAGDSTATTRRRHEAFLETIDAVRAEYPIYHGDWPRKDEPLDLTTHDLPHDSAGTEWWYYHAHVQTESGRDLSLFSVLFKRLFEGDQFAHAHAGVLNVDEDHHEQCSIGDPRAPAEIAPKLAESPHDAYGRRALREVYEKGCYPDPDVKASEPPTVPDDRMAFDLGDVEIRKDGDRYHVELDASGDRSFGFSLEFAPRKGPVLHYEDGVMKGVTSSANMFYYSFTRMDVTGTVTLDGVCEQVEGSGWYDHEFGGGREGEAALGGAHAWLWMGIQLDDGTELGYTTVTSLDTGTPLHEDEILFVSPDGEKRHYQGSIEQLDAWSSMHTYIEYGTAWHLTVPELDLDVTIEAVADRQEMRSVIARPAYWEGRVTVEGERDGEPITGTGLCEQYGQGGDRTDYREYLDDVSREVQRSVADVLPYDVSDEHMQRLVADEDHPELVDDVDKDIFVESGIRPVRTIVDRGGKGWRSMAFLLSAELVGEDPQKLRRYLALPELIHTGSLIVDDVQDNSTRRRGGPACHEMYGEATAINAGTASYFMGERLQTERDHDLSDEQLLELYRLHFMCLRAAHTGQGIDIHGLGETVAECLETGDFAPLWENIRGMHRLKSAVPAMTAARMGAVAAGADEATEDVLGQYFLALGYAFQLVDDAINLRGFQHELKEHAEDIREGKITAPVARAFQVLDDEQRRELWAHLQAPPEAMDIGAILSLVEGCGAVDWCHERARELVEEAWQPVDEHFPESQAKMQLRAFGWFVVDVRDY